MTTEATPAPTPEAAAQQAAPADATPAPATPAPAATESPAPEAVPELTPAQQHEAELNDIFAPESPQTQARDDKGRFAATDGTEAEETPPSPAEPPGTTGTEASEAPTTPETPAEPPAPTFQTATYKVDGQEYSISLNPADEKLNELLRRGHANPQLVERAAKNAMQQAYGDIIGRIRRQGYDLRFDHATGAMTIIPPQAPPSAPAPAPQQEAPSQSPDARIAELDYKAKSEGLTATEATEYTKLVTQNAVAQATKRFEDRFSKWEEQETARRQQADTERQQAAFTNRINDLIAGYSNRFGDDAKRVAARAWNQAQSTANRPDVNTIEQVESDLHEFLSWVARGYPNPTPTAQTTPTPQNGHATAAPPTPPQPAPVPPAVGAGVSGGVSPPEVADDDLLNGNNPNAQKLWGTLNFG